MEFLECVDVRSSFLFLCVKIFLTEPGFFLYEARPQSQADKAMAKREGCI